MARRAGYTLIELMIVVMIIGMSTVVFSPGIGRAVADRRASTVARELIRIGRRARSDTMGLLRAHLVWIDPVAKRVQLIRGSTNSCNLAIAAWGTNALDCPAAVTDVPGRRCLENLSIDAITNTSNIMLYEETLTGSDATYSNTVRRALCYAPNGLVYWGIGSSVANASAAFSEGNSVGGGFVYTVHPGPGAPVATSRIHRVLFPLGGSARSLR